MLKAKMHQIRFSLELCPMIGWGSLQCSPRPQLYLRGLLLRGGKGRERRWREDMAHPKIWAWGPLWLRAPQSLSTFGDYSRRKCQFTEG